MQSVHINVNYWSLPNVLRTHELPPLLSQAGFTVFRKIYKLQVITIPRKHKLPPFLSQAGFTVVHKIYKLQVITMTSVSQRTCVSPGEKG